jgi:hypothetical protein
MLHGGLISLDSVVATLRSTIPDAEWFLRHIESEQGWVRFPPFLSNTIINLQIESYPLLYANERAIGAMLFSGFLSDGEMWELNSEFESATQEERDEFLSEVAGSFNKLIDEIEIPKTLEAQEVARQQFMLLPEEEQWAAIKFGQHFYCYFFASFFQNLSIMVHGEKLTSLVAQAVAGSDEAFVKAIQIDRRILTEYPYFKQRFVSAQFDGNSDFYDLVSYRVNRSPYHGKIRHKILWLTFSMLDLTGHLDKLKHREILDICHEIGMDAWRNRIEDVKNLSKRIDEYRKFQKRGGMYTP